ncbi:SDR family oxidoreductase [Chitinophagaceae bacterium LB-8]|jgi:short-subunit dehydrogenase|uniref:SDR family oxidoreductase n=1 Tax=Paraflavisolibacter caeni TaxID=2982496 RepID=A0A9X2Y056_9BACT|nr:SDR family oxidoreductase [Paraflavisolibacter caeni]MCU7551942.1 SDR family oxidoreductase [Paraflavisolibacter caeni]
MGKNLTGKTVVITGASSGVGRAIALEFARSGADLVLAARREQALTEVAVECDNLGGKALKVITDVTDPVAVKRLAQAAIDFSGKIDVWVNNAGVLAAGAIDEAPVEIHNQVIQTNLIGYINGAAAVIPFFKRQGHGILINNISVGGWFPVPYAIGYSASKFGLRGFSEALRGELHQWHDIHVCDLFPGFLDTPGIQHAANYTGRYIKPAPPVYDPQRVARATVCIAKNPRNAKTIGSTSTFLRLAHAIFPGLSRSITASVIESYLKKAEHTAETSGNLFEPVEFGTSIHGGWSNAVSSHKRTIGLLLFATVAGILLMRQKG